MGILNYEYFFKILIVDFMQSINNKIFKINIFKIFLNVLLQGLNLNDIL